MTDLLCLLSSKDAIKLQKPKKLLKKLNVEQQRIERRKIKMSCET